MKTTVKILNVLPRFAWKGSSPATVTSARMDGSADQMNKNPDLIIENTN